MINETNAKRFCKDYTKIENYELAMNDKMQTWDCHHRNEQYYPKKDLIKLGLYSDCPPCELIFLTKKDHKKLHSTFWYFEETKRKISETKKGKPSWNKGKKPYEMTEETKKKMSKVRKGKHWKIVDGHRVWY